MKNSNGIAEFIRSNSPLPAGEELTTEQAQSVHQIFETFIKQPDLFNSDIWSIFGDTDGYGVYQHIVWAHENLDETVRTRSLSHGLNIKNANSNALACMVLAAFPDPSFRQRATDLALSDDPELVWAAELAIEMIDELEGDS